MEIEELLSENTYPGRGILVGLSPEGRAVSAYFLMGRSENSQNRMLSLVGEELKAEPFDPAKVKDPALIHYTALQKTGDSLVLSNGDHGGHICRGLEEGESFESALEGCTYEPDEPHFTPRISAQLSLKKPFTYKLSVIKKRRDACRRKFFKFNDPMRGCAHLIYTYVSDGNPLPSFTGSPREVTLYEDIDIFGEKLWKALDKSNRIALYVRYTNLDDGTHEERLYNKNTR